ncbi:hypothetical protein CHS0354_012136 [Potamilus streckersoni]|uniref:Uncharacterized protein n=1 Tax=Potamilus streckersoni TaxID=2493646 RepID=A0AAE0S9W2_9BIVA|nr:hypothetical protein CHS0354_012136 [Potamilus streckersoni]
MDKPLSAVEKEIFLPPSYPHPHTSQARMTHQVTQINSRQVRWGGALGFQGGASIPRSAKSLAFESEATSIRDKMKQSSPRNYFITDISTSKPASRSQPQKLCPYNGMVPASLFVAVDQLETLVRSLSEGNNSHDNINEAKSIYQQLYPCEVMKLSVCFTLINEIATTVHEKMLNLAIELSTAGYCVDIKASSVRTEPGWSARDVLEIIVNNVALYIPASSAPHRRSLLSINSTLQ